MTARQCVLDAAVEAGVPSDILTTMADIYKGPAGLPDKAPYNQTVVLKPGVDRESEDAVRWSSFLWKKHFIGATKHIIK